MPALKALKNQYSDRCSLFALDLVDDSSIDHLSEKLAELNPQLDLLIHNAGIFAEGEEGLHTLDREKMNAVMHTNAIGPLMLSKALLPFLKTNSAKVVALTSGTWGEPAVQKQNSQYSYGISKQALWMALHCLKGDLEPRGISVIGLSPGFVQTDMTSGSPVRPPLTVEQSVSNILSNIGLSA